MFFLLWTSVVAWLVVGIGRVVYNVLFHPLNAFPGPIAAKATEWWKTYIEVVKQESMTDVLVRLHKQYGPHSKLRFSLPPLTCS